nr:hypothetical protein [Nakamurella flava]
MANTLLSVEPSTYGRSAAGTSWTTVIQASEVATAEPANAPARTRVRPRAPPWLAAPEPATSVATTRAGRTNQACSILAWNPTPTKRPASSSGHHRAVRTARCHHRNATANAIVSRPSSIGCANIDTKIGVVAAAAAANRPTARPPHRRPISAQAQTVISPSITWGRATAEVERPNRWMLAACGIAKPLSLSRVTVAPGSKAPKSRAFHDCDIDRADAS